MSALCFVFILYLKGVLYMLIKKRNWAMVLYPESAPSNWRDILQNTGLQCCVSPLHDKDLDPTGTPKKAHYHIILVYSGPTSFNVVNQLCSILNCPIPIPLEQIKGYYRYLTHKDNPEKYQYNDIDISTINGFDISSYVELSSSDILSIKKSIVHFIRDNQIDEYSTLVDSILDMSDNSNWFDVVSNHTYFFEKYVTSCRHKG